MSYADFEAPVGGGCTLLRMTRDRLDDPDLADGLGAERERLRGLSIVWSGTGEIVTVVRPRRGAAGRRLPSRRPLGRAFSSRYRNGRSRDPEG